MTLHGLDVSMWQGAPDWATVAASGVTFAVAKATEGTGYTDPTYAVNAQAIPGAGLVGGAYHWLVGGFGDGAAQADHFASVAGDLGGRLAMLDIEDPKYPPTAVDVDAFATRFRVHYPGQSLLCYGSRYNALGKAATSADGPLWLANYGVNAAGSPMVIYAGAGGDASPVWASGFNGWQGPTVWQYGSKGAVPGITGNVDVNAFRGTLDELRALAGGGNDVKIQFKVERWTLDGNPTNKVTTLGAPFGSDGITPDWSQRLASLSDTGGVNPRLELIDRARLTDPDASQDAAFQNALSCYAVPPPPLPDPTPFAQADINEAVSAALLIQSGDLEKLQSVLATIRAALPPGV